MNNGYDANQALQTIFQMRNAGRNPQQIMQMLISKNPQYQQSLAMLQNMAQGKSPQEFISQLARQNGVSEQNMAQLMQMFGKQ
jgi:DNA polymerase III gamma/tau subunit